jgi:hypothetical protein
MFESDNGILLTTCRRKRSRPIQAILGNNSAAAAATILPITSTMANLGIALTGSTVMGFAIGFLKG